MKAGVILRSDLPMRKRLPSSRLATQQAVLRLFTSHSLSNCSDRWRINGYPARLLIWTIEEWESLEQPPADAQLHPSGVWCALRLE
jgi:hypothetical protein